MNAVFERDYVRTSVSWRYLALRAGFALALAGLVAATAVSGWMDRDFMDVGSSVLRFSMWAGFLLVFVAVPGSFGTSLVHARAMNALPILFASPLRPLEVAFGAFAARAAGYAVFVFACWPPVAIALAFGGVQPVQLLHATAALLGTLLLLAGPCFVVSAWARSTGPAVVASYLSAAALLAGLGALGAELAATSPLAASALSPFQALGSATATRASQRIGAEGSYLLLAGGIAVALGSVVLSAWRLQREAAGGLDAAVAATAGRGYRPLRHANPILGRELTSGAARIGRGPGRSLLVVLVLSEIAYAASVWKLGLPQSVPLFGGILVFQTSLLVLAAAAAGATSLSAEKESGALDVVRVTPLSPREIVEGKLLGLARALAPALGVPVAHLAWGVLCGIVSPFAPPAFLVAGAVVSGTWVVVGMSQSLDQRDPHRAVLRTMGMLGIVGFLFAGYLGWVLYAASSSLEGWMRWPASFGMNPAGAILCWVAALRTGGSDAQSTNLNPPTSAETGYGMFVGLVWLALHAGAAWFVFCRLVHLYRTRFEG